MKKQIYLDNAATTKVKDEVLDAMLPFFKENFANPSAIYSFANKAEAAVIESRKTIADVIGANENEIYFTSGGSESDNWALKATAEAYADKGKHIITSKIEHHAILHTLEYLEAKGFEVTYLDVDEDGLINPEELEAEIRDDTILITIMTANNEIGTIEPIKRIGKIAHKHGVLFHTDAVQAFGHIPIDVDAMDIDMLSASGHKINGPKGIGFLYIRKGVKIRSFMHGGAQERKRRAGTHNVPGIVGFAKAASIATKNMEKTIKTLSKAFPDYVIMNPLADINESIDTVCSYIEIALACFSIIAIFISIMLLTISNYLHVLESKKEIGLARCIGVDKKEAKKFLYAHSGLMCFSSFFLSSIELIVISFAISYIVGNEFGGGFTFSFNPLALLLMLVLALTISVFSSAIMAGVISKIPPLEALKS